MDWKNEIAERGEDIAQIIDDASLSIDVYRIQDEVVDNPGFETEVEALEKAVTITGRIDRYSGDFQKVKGDAETALKSFYVGLTESTDVQKNDEWEVDDVRYRIIALEKYSYKTEVLLEIKK